MNLPKPGDKIANGAIVIHATPVKDLEGPALCLFRSASDEHYAVWDLWADTLRRWRGSAGTYFPADQFGEALACYQSRGGVIGENVRY